MCVCVPDFLQGSATLSMAYAAALFGDAVLRGLNGATATECAYVESDVTDVPYFATKVKLGTEGEWGLPEASGSGRKGHQMWRAMCLAMPAAMRTSLWAQGMLRCCRQFWLFCEHRLMNGNGC